MIIYKCAISNDEMFSDIYKIKDNGILIEVEGKYITRTDKFDDALIGANASAEEACESDEDSAISGVDIVINHKLQETGFKKKDYMRYIKTYLKAILEHLQMKNPERVDQFKEETPTVVKKILAEIEKDRLQFFTGESMNPDGAVGLLNYRDDGVTPFMVFFKDGLIIEKC